MALFKINKGMSQNLPSLKTEGTVYLTTDEGKLYVDADSSTRLVVNAANADTIKNSVDGSRIKVNYSASNNYDCESIATWQKGQLVSTSFATVLQKINGVSTSDSRLSDARTPKPHTHILQEISLSPIVGSNKEINLPGNNYASYFEWQDGNPSKEDRVGYCIAFAGDKIRISGKGTQVLGIVTGNPAVIADSDALEPDNKYLRDDFGRIQLDSRGEPLLNSAYDPNVEYIPKGKDPKWAAVGTWGKILARDDGTCEAGSFAKINANGILTLNQKNIGVRVLKRISSNVVMVFLR